MMHIAYPQVVPAPVYEPILEYIPMAMDQEKEDPSKEKDPSKGTYGPIIDWDMDSDSSFYYSNSSSPSSRGSRISSQGHGRGRGCHF